MFKIKRLYLFVLQTFLPLFVMTFFICLFIVLMQFLWRYIDDLVGKGLDVTVIAELFFYAALTMVPLALPLAIIVSLVDGVRQPWRTLGTYCDEIGRSIAYKGDEPVDNISVVCVGRCIFFSKQCFAKAQVKMWSLLFFDAPKVARTGYSRGCIL